MIARTLPWGQEDLDPVVEKRAASEPLVRCFVSGCGQWLRPARRDFAGDCCSEHGIRCHVSGSGGTYSYRDPADNIIIDREAFTSKLLRHPDKFESHRLGSERSEDALTWNVFRWIWKKRRLDHLAYALTGVISRQQPQLFLWGISMDDFQPWPLLEAARRRFEQRLPEGRPPTEPDIALYLPGRYLVLIEAKFTSANTYCDPLVPPTDPRKLSFEALASRYWPDEPRIVAPERLGQMPRVPQQLWRNLIFAEWMARHDGLYGITNRAFVINLVRAGYEQRIESEIWPLMQRGTQRSFRRWTWEKLYEDWLMSEGKDELAHYLQSKTAGLIPAFRLPR